MGRGWISIDCRPERAPAHVYEVSCAPEPGWLNKPNLTWAVRAGLAFSYSRTVQNRSLVIGEFKDTVQSGYGKDTFGIGRKAEEDQTTPAVDQQLA